jgi:dTDP-4-amino-4,6-dideoxygalactose transaminase
MTDQSVPLTVMDKHDPELLDELLSAVREVASSGSFAGGVFVERFETAFAGWCGIDNAVGVSSGTEALVLILRALGVGPGDEVIVPANSFFATAEAVSLAGATPRFADVDADTQLVTAETIAAAHGPSVCGVIPVHLFGRTVELSQIAELTRRWGVWLVEDCAQAHGARYAGQRVGTWGDAAAFSFYPAKNLGAWGDGGAVITNRADIADHVRLLRSHGERPRYHHRVVGTTGRLDALQAAVLERKLAHLEGWNAARRAVADELRQRIDGGSEVVLPPPANGRHDHVYHQFVVRAGPRDELRAHLDRRGVASAIHYPIPIHRSEAYADLRPGGQDVAPVATQLAGEICSLPIFPGMTAEQIDRVASAVTEFATVARSRRAA